MDMVRIVHTNLIQIHTKRATGAGKRTENVEFNKKRCVKEFNVSKEIVDDIVSIAAIEIKIINEKSPTPKEDNK